MRNITCENTSDNYPGRITRSTSYLPQPSFSVIDTTTPSTTTDIPGTPSCYRAFYIPSQRLLALADATVNATTSPLPFDNQSPNPPLSSIPATLNPSPSCPLTPVTLHHTQSPLPSFFRNQSQSPPLEYQETPLMIFGIGTLSRSDHRVRSSSGFLGFRDLGQDYEDGFQRGVVPKEEVGHVKHHMTNEMTSKDYTSQT